MALIFNKIEMLILGIHNKNVFIIISFLSNFLYLLNRKRQIYFELM